MAKHLVVSTRGMAMALEEGSTILAPLHYASLPRRVAAAIVDVCLIVLASTILVLGPWALFVGQFIVPDSIVDWIGEALQGPGPKDFGWEIGAQYYAGMLLLWLLLTPLVFCLYGALSESSSTQATLGKRVCRIVVTDLEGRPVLFRRALKRNLWKVASAIIFPIGLLVIFFSQREQSLHDAMAGTLVLRRAGASDGQGSNTH